MHDVLFDFIGNPASIDFRVEVHVNMRLSTSDLHMTS